MGHSSSTIITPTESARKPSFHSMIITSPPSSPAPSISPHTGRFRRIARLSLKRFERRRRTRTSNRRDGSGEGSQGKLVKIKAIGEGNQVPLVRTRQPHLPPGARYAGSGAIQRFQLALNSQRYPNLGEAYRDLLSDISPSIPEAPQDRFSNTQGRNSAISRQVEPQLRMQPSLTRNLSAKGVAPPNKQFPRNDPWITSTQVDNTSRNKLAMARMSVMSERRQSDRSISMRKEVLVGNLGRAEYLSRRDSGLSGRNSRTSRRPSASFGGSSENFRRLSLGLRRDSTFSQASVGGESAYYSAHEDDDWFEEEAMRDESATVRQRLRDRRNSSLATTNELFARPEYTTEGPSYSGFGSAIVPPDHPASHHSRFLPTATFAQPYRSDNRQTPLSGRRARTTSPHSILPTTMQNLEHKQRLGENFQDTVDDTDSTTSADGSKSSITDSTRGLRSSFSSSVTYLASRPLPSPFESSKLPRGFPNCPQLSSQLRSSYLDIDDSSDDSQSDAEPIKSNYLRDSPGEGFRQDLSQITPTRRRLPHPDSSLEFLAPVSPVSSHYSSNTLDTNFNLPVPLEPYSPISSVSNSSRSSGERFGRKARAERDHRKRIIRFEAESPGTAYTTEKDDLNSPALSHGDSNSTFSIDGSGPQTPHSTISFKWPTTPTSPTRPCRKKKAASSNASGDQSRIPRYNAFGLDIAAEMKPRLPPARDVLPLATPVTRSTSSQQPRLTFENFQLRADTGTVAPRKPSMVSPLSIPTQTNLEPMEPYDNFSLSPSSTPPSPDSTNPAQVMRASKLSFIPSSAKITTSTELALRGFHSPAPNTPMPFGSPTTTSASFSSRLRESGNRSVQPNHMRRRGSGFGVMSESDNIGGSSYQGRSGSSSNQSPPPSRIPIRTPPSPLSPKIGSFGQSEVQGTERKRMTEEKSTAGESERWGHPDKTGFNQREIRDWLVTARRDSALPLSGK